MGNLGLLFMLLFFIFAALGVELFGDLSKEHMQRVSNKSHTDTPLRPAKSILTLPPVGLIYRTLITFQNPVLKCHIDFSLSHFHILFLAYSFQANKMLIRLLRFNCKALMLLQLSISPFPCFAVRLSPSSSPSCCSSL